MSVQQQDHRLFYWQERRHESFKRWFLACGLELLIMASIIGLALYADTPNDIPGSTSVLRCPFHRLTGHSCPGCGLTRAFIAMAHGQFADALSWNILVVIMFPAVICRLFMRLSETIWGRYPVLKVGQPVLWSFAAIVIIFGLGRLILELTGSIATI